MSLISDYLSAPPYDSCRITAQVVIPEGGADGVIVSNGGRYGGYVLFVDGDHLIYENNFVGEGREIIRSQGRLPRGKATLEFEFVRRGGAPPVSGLGRLYINGWLDTEATLQHVGRIRSEFGVLTVGESLGSPVSPAYQNPFSFTGDLETVTIRLLPGD